MRVYMCANTVEIAMENLNIAFKGFKALNEYTLPKKVTVQDKLRLTHYLCTYSRFVHVNIWQYRVSISEVKQVMIPEFRKARSRIRRILRCNGEFTGLQTQKLKRYEHNVLGRERNLLDYYCKGLPSAFDFEIKDPPVSPKRTPQRANHPA